MTTSTRVLRVGTRKSPLARWQAAVVIGALSPVATCEEVLITTEGERAPDVPLPEIGGEGVFTAALERALHAGHTDFAVHSLKDLPLDQSDGLVVAAVGWRADPRDVMIGRHRPTLATLPRGATVATSSNRRMAQLRAARSDLTIVPLRGNVDTRVRKALSPKATYDAIVIAAAGVERLGLQETVSEILSAEVMLPAPGQGALAVQCRADDRATQSLFGPLDDPVARAATTAERAFLAGLGGGCSAPVAALAAPAPADPALLRLSGLVASLDGQQVVRVAGSGAITDPLALARRLADEAISRGASALLR